jgi:predicted PurR-regulated permease PerM
MIAEDRPEDADARPDARSGSGAGGILRVTGQPLDFGRVFRLGAAAGLGLLTVALAVFAVYNVRQILVQVIIALFVAVSLDPAVRWLINRGVRRSVAVTIIFVLTLLLLAGFVWSITPPLVRQASELAAQVPDYLRELPEKSKAYREIADRYGLTQRLTEYAQQLPGKIGADAIGFLSRFLGAVLNVLLVTVLTIYFMLDLPRLRRGLVRLFPRSQRPRVAQAVNVVVDKVGGYMIGNLIISFFAGASAFVCLLLVGVPFALPLALFVAITDLIPLVGATIAAVLVGIVTLFADFPADTIAWAIWAVIYQQIENTVIQPQIQRRAVDVHPLVVLVSVLCGSTLFGIAGALMAIPVAASLQIAVGEWWDWRQEQQLQAPRARPPRQEPDAAPGPP